MCENWLLLWLLILTSKRWCFWTPTWGICSSAVTHRNDTNLQFKWGNIWPRYHILKVYCLVAVLDHSIIPVVQRLIAYSKNLLPSRLDKPANKMQFRPAKWWQFCEILIVHDLVLCFMGYLQSEWIDTETQLVVLLAIHKNTLIVVRSNCS